MSSLFIVVRKELRELMRDRVTVAICAAFFGALLVNCVASGRQQSARDASQRERQAASREGWLGQSSTSAHDATHRGMTVFKRTTPLAAIDPGTASVLGSAVRLESHKRNEPTGVPGRDRL
ncbi:MAG: ABC transporter permease, partial [Planctomycetota bacterium]